MMATYVDVRKTKASENFNTKSKLLGVEMNRQVDALNKTYDGNLKFKVCTDFYTDKEVIEICWVNPSIRILELPEVDSLKIGYINSYTGDSLFRITENTVGTLKIPKSMQSLRWSDISQFHNLTSLWVWDTTIIEGERGAFSPVKMLFIQSTKGGKTQVYRF